MTDPFKTHSRGLTTPPENAAALQPSDTAAIPTAPRALYVGEAGDLAVRMLGGATVTLANVPAGSLLPIRVERVLATGTTAARIIGFW